MSPPLLSAQNSKKNTCLPALHTLLSLFALLTLIFNPLTTPARDVLTLSSNWKFAKGHHENAWKISFDDSKWEHVTIPHDWAISGPFIPDGDGNTGKLSWKGEGWYRTTLDIPLEFKGKCVYLVFDGIMSAPEIFLNGKTAGKWDYGYNSFYLDVTSLIRVNNPNTLAIHVDTRNHDSRWYPGAGIFRKIQMIAVNQLHVGIWGTYITTPLVHADLAEVRVVTTIVNKSVKRTDELNIQHIIFSPMGKEIARKMIRGSMATGENSDFEVTIPVMDPEKWDVNHGALYSAKTLIFEGDNILDSCMTPFGIRTIRFTADDGFFLNDRRVQLKGVNLHHDLGPLGAAFNLRAMERQLELLKSMGCNAVRTSHNTAAPELLDLCDKMGMLVFNEVFDKYDQKADITAKTDFEEFASRNIRNFVIRDRNHPSVFIWSVGNEMGDVQNNLNNGFQQLNTMLKYVRKYDTTRFTTMVCDNRNSAVNRHFDFYDVHCWNYGRRYELARQMEPSKSVIISESASTVSARGFYELPLPARKTDFTNSLQVSSYDLHAPSWAEIADDDFMWQQDEPYVAGEFVWTGFDYLGEPTPYTNEWAKENGMTDKEAAHSSYFGILDLCGIPKDRYYLYKSYWNPSETTVHILPHWNWPGKEGASIPVFVYTNGDCAELFLNGRSLGKRCKVPGSKNSVERFRLMWNDVVYEPGILKAVAYKDEQAIGEEIMKTAGEPYALKLTPDRFALQANGDDLSYILVEAVDEQGTECPLSDNEVEFTIIGSGSIAGVGNGNPHSLELFQANRIHLFYGKAMLIVRAGHIKEEIGIIATSKGLLQDMKTVITE
ncbi:MAG: glycoside hydrolase family 2 TIM barrel-domain containing protein [Bacteroidales bacterium]|nr:glycoside hydrolase family 2 TIM barrel-domain containing protein [Bacteroidales bacterium]